MSAQDRTFEQYHQLMQINAASHLIRAAREIRLLAELREGQRTREQLCDKLDLDAGSTSLLLDGLVAIGIIEKYEDDFALSRAAHLLCQYDDDLGDARWDRLVQRMRGQGDRQDHDDQLLAALDLLAVMMGHVGLLHPSRQKDLDPVRRIAGDVGVDDVAGAGRTTETDAGRATTGDRHILERCRPSTQN